MSRPQLGEVIAAATTAPIAAARSRHRARILSSGIDPELLALIDRARARRALVRFLVVSTGLAIFGGLIAVTLVWLVNGGAS